MDKKHVLLESTFTAESIDYAIVSTWLDLLDFDHPLFGKSGGGPANCRIDALPQNFLSCASGQGETDGCGNIWPKINAWMIPSEELPRMVQWLRDACTPRQVKQIRALFSRINAENQLNRTRKRDRSIWLHDIIFEKWNKEDGWAVVMRAICEQFEIPLPPEFMQEWNGG